MSEPTPLGALGAYGWSERKSEESLRHGGTQPNSGGTNLGNHA